MAIAPFEVEVLPVNTSHQESMDVAMAIYRDLQARGIDVIIDDRNERPGIKFKDCDLIGIPVRVTVGERNLKEGMVEFKLRGEKESEKVSKDAIIEKVIDYVKKSKRL